MGKRGATKPKALKSHTSEHWPADVMERKHDEVIKVANLVMMANRLLELHGVFKTTHSLYFHCE